MLDRTQTVKEFVRAWFEPAVFNTVLEPYPLLIQRTVRVPLKGKGNDNKERDALYTRAIGKIH